MTDINDVMPKIPSMKWGALMNRAPTNGKVKELNRIFPHNGKWHTVFEEKDHTYIDDKIHFINQLVGHRNLKLEYHLIEPTKNIATEHLSGKNETSASRDSSGFV